MSVVLLLIIFCLTIHSEAFNLENNACAHLYDYPVKSISESCYYNPNVKSSTPEMVKENGYEVISYKVTTPDGYILQLFRIPPKEIGDRKKQPVYLHHGLFVDSGAWVFTGNRSLAFNLADQGYDVWLGNERGTKYSRAHLTLKASNPKFWDYNLDDLMGDLTVSLEKVAEITKQAGSIIYIGHSRGTTLIFMLASQYPEKAQKLLQGVVALSPIVYFDTKFYINILIEAFPAITEILETFKITAIFYHMKFIIDFQQVFCTYFPYICRLSIDISSGRTRLFLADDLLNFFSHFPDTASVPLLLQYAQMHNSGNFQKFDYGKTKNLEIYGQEKPPLYDLRKFKLPIFMYYGKHDNLITEKSVKKVFKQLGSTEKKFSSVPAGVTGDQYQFGHNDFYYAKTLREFYYRELFKTLELF